MSSFYNSIADSSLGSVTFSGMNMTQNSFCEQDLASVFNNALRWSEFYEELLPDTSQVNSFFQNDDEVKILFSQLLSESNAVSSEELNEFEKENKMDEEVISKFLNEKGLDVESKLVLTQASIDRMIAEENQLQVMKKCVNCLMKHLESELKQKEKSVVCLKETLVSSEVEVENKIKSFEFIMQSFTTHYDEFIDAANKLQNNTNNLEITIKPNSALSAIDELNKEAVDILNKLFEKFHPVACSILTVMASIDKKLATSKNTELKINFLTTAIEWLGCLTYFNRLFEFSQNIYKCSSVILNLHNCQTNKNTVVYNLISEVMPIMGKMMSESLDIKEDDLCVFKGKTFIDEISKWNELITSSSDLITVDNVIQNLRDFDVKVEEAYVKLDQHFEVVNAKLVKKINLIRNNLKKMDEKIYYIQDEIKSVNKINENLESSKSLLAILKQNLQGEGVGANKDEAFSNLIYLLFTDTQLFFEKVKNLENKCKVLEKIS